MEAHQDARVSSMYRRDLAAAFLSIVAVWAVYVFTLWRMADQLSASGVFMLMLALGTIVLLLNTAAVVALARHYRDDKAAIYGTDIYYLDRISAEREAAR
jgi:uncharacterized membrane protein YiaA